MKLLLLLLPAVALASIEVHMYGKVFFDTQYIQGSITQRGFEKRAIINNDRDAFQIHDHELKSAAESHLGKKPDQLFLTRNTPWGDLYIVHGGIPVQVKIEPGTPYLVEMSTKEEVLTRKIYENVHSRSRSVDIAESATKQDTVTSYWTNPRQVSGNDVEITFNYYVGNQVIYMSHAFTFGFNRRVAAPKLRRQHGSINLAPGQKVFAQLEAMKGTLKFQIPYKVSLSGDVAVWYRNGYKGQTSYVMNINHLLAANHRNATLTVHQTVLFEFYYGERLKIINAVDGYSVLRTIEESETSGGHRRRADAAEHAAETGKKITMTAAMVPSELSDEDLKAIEEEVVQNKLDEESESKED